ncbi:zinc-ribbon domain-containing protein [Veillonella intestinalis]|uniref:zinc-ribbon domain-containing protein n=1 Tax=Veillonella intestinalis TaxID=2941341 RepID=UPI00203B70CE|nr:zinc ribbon domain-containing protein [Veillonella intestinalis]
MKYICTQCNAENSGDNKFCYNCGARLQETVNLDDSSLVESNDNTQEEITNNNVPQLDNKKRIIKYILGGLLVILVGFLGVHFLGFGDTAYITTVQTMQLTKSETLGDRVTSVLLIEGGKNARVENIKWTVVRENKKGKIVEARLNKTLWVEIQTYQRKDMIYVDPGDIVLHNKTYNNSRILF